MNNYALGGFRRLRAAFRMARMNRHLFETEPPQADERIPYGPEALQFGELRLPHDSEGQRPLVVVIHGGFWRNRYSLEHIGFVCEALRGAGYATWSLEYRRIGDEGGAWPGTFLDVGMGVDYARTIAPQYNLDLERVIVMGHSAGGHLALWAAGRHTIGEGDPLYTRDPLRPKAAISLAGVSDLKRGWELKLSGGVVYDLMGGAPEEEPERYRAASPIEMLPLDTRQILIHGTEDDAAPYSLSYDYKAAATAAGDSAELITLRGTGHFELIDPQMREWGEVLEAVMRET